MLVYMEKLKVAIIGCGNIAGKFDLALPEDGFPCTHAGAYSKSKHFEILMCIDPNEHNVNLFKNKWNISESYTSTPSSSDIDVVSICSPTGSHLESVEEAILLQPKLIFCEKPIALNVKDTQTVINLCDENNIILAVNYTRRWDPEIIKLKKSVCTGELRTITAFYNKGVMNNASHLINIFQWIFGDLTIKYVGHSYIDYETTDPTCSFVLATNKGVEIIFSSGNSNDYTNFEVKFVFSKIELTLLNGGMNWLRRRPVPSENFIGYTTLSAAIIDEGGYKYAMSKAIENIYGVLSGKEELESGAGSALETQLLCESIIKKTTISGG
jgi:predicted dehydrogenase